MSKFHWRVIGKSQRKALISLGDFARIGVLGGGTALALQLGHRMSVDLDFFLPKPISLQFVARIQRLYKSIETIIRTGDEFTFVSPQKVKITFLFYPYSPLYARVNMKHVQSFHWKDIALDKAHTIGRRHEWRDYVDLYWCVRNGFALKNIIQGAEKKFGDSFSAKLFLSQLVYLKDIEEFSSVEFIGRKISPNVVQKFFEQGIKKLHIFS